MPHFESMSDVERLILYNQYRILALLARNGEQTSYYGDAQDFDNAAIVIKRNYTRDFDLLAGQGFEEYLTSPVSPNVCTFVISVLNMYSALFTAKEQGKEVSGRWVNRFQGFDGHNEGEHLSYLLFVRDGLRSYKFLDLTFDNSHSTTLGVYRAMLKAWKESNNPDLLTEADVRRIDQASQAPER